MFKIRTLLDVATALLTEAFEADEGWRRPRPVSPGTDAPDRLADEVRRFVDQRLDELRAAVGAWDGGSPATLRAVRRVAARARPGGVPTTGAVTPDAVLPVTPTARLTCALERNATGAPTLHLFHGAEVVWFDDPRLVPFGLALTGHASFLASSCCAWGDGYGWDELQPLLEALIDAGILRIEPPTPP